MLVISEITIDVLNAGNPPRVYAMQGDSNSRAVKINLKNNGQPLVVPDGAWGVVRYHREDGQGSSYDTTPFGVACVFGESDVTVLLSQNLTAANGLAHVSVDIKTENSSLHTFSFDLMVEKNPGIFQSESGGYYVAGVVPDSGWSADKYLGTDSSGKVVTKDPPESGTGITPEQSAQIQANTDAIAELRKDVSSVSITEEPQKWTIALSLADGITETTVLETDANNYPTRLTVNGREIPVTVTGV